MLPESVRQSVSGLFSICVAAASMDLFVGDGASARSLRGLCALAAAVCALRAVLSLLKL